MEDLFLTIEQARHLQELGVDMSDAKMCKAKLMKLDNGDYVPSNEFHLISMEYSNLVLDKKRDLVPTYSLQELLNKMPKVVRTRMDEFYFHIWNEDNGDNYTIAYGRWESHTDDVDFNEMKSVTGNLLDSAYKLFCWLYDSGWMEYNKSLKQGD